MKIKGKELPPQIIELCLNPSTLASIKQNQQPQRWAALALSYYLTLI